MFKMTHLGPHTVVARDNHHSGHEWLTHFGRDERHHLVEEDRAARLYVAMVFFSALAAGLTVLIVVLLSFV